MNDARKSFIQKKATEQNVVKMAQAIYEGDDSVNRDYYNSILNALYLRVGNENLIFSGIVTNVISTKKGLEQVEICNVFWDNVYITNRLCVDHDGFGIYNRGDFVIFKASIKTYNMNKFTIVGIQQITAKDEFVDLGYPEKATVSNCLKTLLEKPYAYKKNLYDKLCLRTQIDLIMSDIIPYKYYNTMISSLYFRYQKEDYLYRIINDEVPYEEDLNNLLIIHLFVRWLIDDKGVYNPGQIFFCLLQFIYESTTNNLRDISKRNGINYKEIARINNLKFIYLLDSEKFYLKEHIVQFINDLKI